jgi:hypothetical protein
MLDTLGSHANVSFRRLSVLVALTLLGVWSFTGAASALPPAKLRAMAKRSNATLTSIPTSHVPMLSRPQDVVAVILSAAAATRPTTTAH